MKALRIMSIFHSHLKAARAGDGMKVSDQATAAEMKPAILLQMLLETPEEESGITDDQKYSFANT